MKKKFGIFGAFGLAAVVFGLLLMGGSETAVSAATSLKNRAQERNIAPESEIDVAILVGGRPLHEYAARGRR